MNYTSRDLLLLDEGITLQQLQIQTQAEVVRRIRAEASEKELKNAQRQGFLIPREQVEIFVQSVVTELMLIFNELDACAPLLVMKEELEVDAFFKTKINEYRGRMTLCMQEKMSEHLVHKEKGTKVGTIMGMT